MPKFKAQIEAGSPVTVTHPEMVRYFITIRRPATWWCRRRAMCSDVSVYVLNMGQSVKTLDLAERMIRLSGLEPGCDVQIDFTGISTG